MTTAIVEDVTAEYRYETLVKALTRYLRAGEARRLALEKSVREASAGYEPATIRAAMALARKRIARQRG